MATIIEFTDKSLQDDLVIYSNVQGDRVYSPYGRLAKFLGQGTFGVVFKVRDANNTFLAEKRTRALVYKAFLENFQRSIEILKKIPAHPCIISTTAFFYNKTWRSISVFYPFAAGGDLGARIHKQPSLTLANREVITEAVLLALAHLHQYGVVHRDIKLENVLLIKKDSQDQVLKSSDVKLADFDSLCWVNCPPNEMQGTLPCYSPTLKRLWLRMKSKNLMVSSALQTALKEEGVLKKGDVWGAGMILVNLINPKARFAFEDKTTLPTRRLVNQVVRSLQCSVTMQKLITRMLKSDDKGRWSIEECLSYFYKEIAQFVPYGSS